MPEDRWSHHAIYSGVGPKTHLALLGAYAMPKELKQKKEAKKKPALTPKEKKAAKRSKKEGKLAASA